MRDVDDLLAELDEDMPKMEEKGDQEEISGTGKAMPIPNTDFGKPSATAEIEQLVDVITE